MNKRLLSAAEKFRVWNDRRRKTADRVTNLDDLIRHLQAAVRAAQAISESLVVSPTVAVLEEKLDQDLDAFKELEEEGERIWDRLQRLARDDGRQVQEAIAQVNYEAEPTTANKTYLEDVRRRNAAYYQRIGRLLD